MSQPLVHIGCVANLYSRMMHFEKAGDIEIGHTHQFDHLTLLAKGKLKVTVEGVVTEFTAPIARYLIWFNVFSIPVNELRRSVEMS